MTERTVRLVTMSELTVGDFEIARVVSELIEVLAIVVIVILAVINFYGVKLGGRVQVAMTATKVVLIAGIVVGDEN